MHYSFVFLSDAEYTFPSIVANYADNYNYADINVSRVIYDGTESTITQALLQADGYYQKLYENYGKIIWYDENNENEENRVRFNNVTFTTNPSPVPEPTSLLLFGTGIVGLVGSRIRRKK